MILFRGWIARSSIEIARKLRAYSPQYETLRKSSLFGGTLSLIIGVLFLTGLTGLDASSMSADDIRIGAVVEPIALIAAGSWSILMSRRWARSATAEGDLVLGRKLTERQYRVIVVAFGIVCCCVALLVVADFLTYEF